MAADTFFVFAYGSLIFDPELPHELINTAPAVLRGWKRSFNKVSHSRKCPANESFAAFEPQDPRLFRDGCYVSIVLGTSADADAEVHGLALEYPIAVRASSSGSWIVERATIHTEHKN